MSISKRLVSLAFNNVKLCFTIINQLWFTGVPYVARKLIAASSPTMEISQNNDDWTIKTISLIRTVTIVFKLNEEYEEQMPGGLLKVLFSSFNYK